LSHHKIWYQQIQWGTQSRLGQIQKWLQFPNEIWLMYCDVSILWQ
jgi:hypothetical protein